MFVLDSCDEGVGVLHAALASLGGLSAEVDDCVRIDRIALLERLKCAAAAVQAAETAAFARSQRAAQAAGGVPAERAGRGVAAQVGLAKRQSPYHATRYVGWSAILTTELPATCAALYAGEITEWRAMIVARETAWLSREHRAEIDTDIAADLKGWGDRRVENEVKRRAYGLDPRGYLDRVGAAAADRHVSVRPAPDVMSRLTAVVPVAEGIAAYAALRQHADTLIAAGDPRSRGQLMADILIERITGQADAADVSVEIQLLMTDRTLLGDISVVEPSDDTDATDDTHDTHDTDDTDADEPAQLIGHGPIPADVARRLVSGPSDHTSMWIRRLYLDPLTGELAAMDSRRRCFTPAQRRFVVARDRTCRTPWCDAPIRHIDHVRPAEHDGPTHTDNGQGYCAACNYARQAHGWRAEANGSGAGESVTVTTPTGHSYTSRPPDPVGPRLRRSSDPPDAGKGAGGAAKPRAA